MQITQEQLVVEAGQMALELRLKDRTITAQAGQIQAMAAEIERMRAEAAAAADDAPDGSGEPADGTREPASADPASNQEDNPPS
jgi:hypothetical protein